MDKLTAIRVLGGTPTAAAAALRISRSALSQWPPVLPLRLEDRVLAALARQALPADLLAELGLQVAAKAPAAADV